MSVPSNSGNPRASAKGLGCFATAMVLPAVLAIVVLAACATTRQAEPSPTAPTPNVEQLAGAWRLDGEPSSHWRRPEMLEIDSEHWTWASATGVRYRWQVIEEQGQEIEVSFQGIRMQFAARLESDQDLVLRKILPGDLESKFGPVEARFRRFDPPPAFFDIAPLELGPTSPLAPERLQSIVVQLAERRQRDQAIRQPPHSRKRNAEMEEIDTANTAWLAEVVTEVGWIDGERFGKPAVLSAFLLVQHSGSLALRLAALPEVEREVAAGNLFGEHLALLHDRTQLKLGHLQRYGSQLVPGPDGMTVVAPLEDPANVDSRRAEIGMKPLTEYLDGYRNDQQPGKIAVLEQF